MEQKGYLEQLPPPARQSGSSPLVLVTGVQFSLPAPPPPAGATSNALVSGFSGFSVKRSQVPRGPQS